MSEGDEKKGGWLARIRSGLSRSSEKMSGGIGALFSKRKLDAETLEELEELLIAADLGVKASAEIAGRLAKTRFDSGADPEAVKAVLADAIAAILEPVAKPLALDPGRKPHVVLMVGVNGSGKTTTIGKLAHYYRRQGLSVSLAAGDTFRAAAVEQLKVWGERAGCPVFSAAPGADAAGLAFDALAQARKRGDDLLLIDTAGRLQNKSDLMAELQKIVRVLKKQDETVPHDVLLVLDATVGQNAHSQVEIFRQITNVTGLVVTKLDGSARGGVLVALADRFGLPVHAIGVGEGADDLRPFSGADFARSLVGLN
ncbi:MAG: signal recognition particle-docking protein FtsY [Rhodospirillaceae bacterium]|nr:signal recognition particle-docking protein FtsY [Rhodospirillaceae bacterium]